MTVQEIRSDALRDVLDLFAESFQNDPYYMKLFPDENSRVDQMKKDFLPQIGYCLQNGLAYGIFDGEKLIAFVLTIQCDQLRRDRSMYDAVFGLSHDDDNSPVKQTLQKQISVLSDQTVYCLSVAVSDEYRNHGLASVLIDRILDRFPSFPVVSDVSNKESLKIYTARGFTVEELGTDYFFIKKEPHVSAEPYPFSSEIRLALPDSDVLDRLSLPYKFIKNRYIADITVDSGGFVTAEDSLVEAKIYEIDYLSLLKYQRIIGLSDFEEKDGITYVYYVRFRKNEFTETPDESELVKDRQREWDIVPDVYVSIPCTYGDAALLKSKKESTAADAVLHNLDFRTRYESGICSEGSENYDETAIFKNRIKRAYLGEITVQLCDENTLNDPGNCALIGKPYHVDVYVSYDIHSRCAVVGIYSLSCPFILSIFFDNIVRNQIMVITDGHTENLYDYLSRTFRISKSGSPKIYSVIPHDRNCLSPGQIGSLLSGETIYSDGENFGQIIDKDIIEAVNSPNGMGQYNRGCVLAYLNVVLQFDDRLTASQNDRIAEEIITQFYIELIMFEEAAINMTDIAITGLLANPVIEDPVTYLKKSERIHENYSKTICFWDIHVNYPTSQKSLKMLRNAFAIDQQLEKMERNKSQLQAVFDAKCEIIDRQQSKRVDTSLAVLAVLAIFSALMDCYDFIGAWTDYIGPDLIKILQIGFSGLIIAIGVSVSIHLSNNKTVRKLRAKKEKK